MDSSPSDAPSASLRFGTSPSKLVEGKNLVLLSLTALGGGDVEERDRGGHRTRTVDKHHLSASPLSGQVVQLPDLETLTSTLQLREEDV